MTKPQSPPPIWPPALVLVPPFPFSRPSAALPRRRSWQSWLAAVLPELLLWKNSYHSGKKRTNLRDWYLSTIDTNVYIYIYILYMDVRWCKIMNDLMIYPGAKWEVDNFNLRLPQQTWWCSTSPIRNHASMFRFHPDEFNGWKRHIIWHWWIGFCRVTVANSHRISGQGFIWFICHWLLQGPPHYVRQPV